MTREEAARDWERVEAVTSEPDGAVVLESDSGGARVVVISYDRYRELDETFSRHKLEREIAAFEAEFSGRFDDLTEEEKEALALSLGNEVNQALSERLESRVAGLNTE